MYDTAVAVAIPAERYENPFKALCASTVNMAEMVFEFMYGTPERTTMTYILALALTFYGFGLEQAQNAGAMRDCPVTGL